MTPNAALLERRTPNLVLTRTCEDDLDDFLCFYSDPQVTATLGGLRSAEWVTEYLQKQIAHWEEHGFGYWTARDALTGRFAGRGGLRHATVEDRVEIEVGYGLMSEFWGRGLATELAQESVRVAFTEVQLADLVCFTLITNFASQKVMEKAGFRYEREFVYAELPHKLYRLTASEWRQSSGAT